VYKNIFAAAVRLDKSKTLGRFEPLHSTCRRVCSPSIAPSVILIRPQRSARKTGPFLGLDGLDERSALSFRCCSLTVARGD
jgi:hypothetical protein